jgi:hypothetical protein
MIISFVIPAAPGGSVPCRHVARLRRNGEQDPDRRQQAAQQERDDGQRHKDPVCRVGRGLRTPDFGLARSLNLQAGNPN